MQSPRLVAFARARPPEGATWLLWRTPPRILCYLRR
jgi:hypothetical protein